MLNLDRLKTSPGVFRSLIGLSQEAFDKLLPNFQTAYRQGEQQKQQNQKRQRQEGGGRKPVLESDHDKLFFILFYFRQYPTQETIAFLFGISQAQANHWIHRLTPVLNDALGFEQQLPARKPQQLEQLMESCVELEFIIDGVERPIRRPQDPERRKSDYSGKKKRHTKKNIVLTEKETGKILGVSDTEAGSKHDKKCADEYQFRFPEGSTLYQDTGFQGYAPEQVVIKQPKKKPRGGELSEQEKAANRLISQQRIGVEHSLGGTKIFRIVSDTFRNFKEGYVDSVIQITCGLFNFNLEVRLQMGR